MNKSLQNLTGWARTWYIRHRCLVIFDIGVWCALEMKCQMSDLTSGNQNQDIPKEALARVLLVMFLLLLQLRNCLVLTVDCVGLTGLDRLEAVDLYNWHTQSDSPYVYTLHFTLFTVAVSNKQHSTGASHRFTVYGSFLFLLWGVCRRIVWTFRAMKNYQLIDF